jgi:CRISPR-associated endonuclease/helicase Cas3
MVFSCLVDADSLDTERHFQAGTYAKREWNASLQEWKRLLDDKQQTLQANAQAATSGSAPAVNQVRREVYNYCIAAGGITSISRGKCVDSAML